MRWKAGDLDQSEDLIRFFERPRRGGFHQNVSALRSGKLGGLNVQIVRSANHCCANPRVGQGLPQEPNPSKSRRWFPAFSADRRAKKKQEGLGSRAIALLGITKLKRNDSGVLREVIAEHPSGMLIVMAIDAEILPVAAVCRIIPGVAVLMMDCQEVKGGAVEFPAAFRADPPVNRQGPLTVPGRLAGFRIADEVADFFRVDIRLEGSPSPPSFPESRI